MKRILLITGFLGLTILFTSAISILETPQDPPHGKKTTKHIKMVKIDDDGKKTELDTIIENNDVFIWNGDTIGGEHGMKWISEGDIEMDFDVEVLEGTDGKVIIMKSGSGGEANVMVISGDEDSDDMIFETQHTPKVMMMKMPNQGNVIDLSDPGIISYEKKDLKDGKEKITIVRKKSTEKDMEMHKMIMHGGSAHPMMIHSGHPGETKTIKVISGDDGNVEIIENGKVRHVRMDGKNVKIIEEDGKTIRIEEINDDNEKTIKVKVVKEEIIK
ncbi:MAG: hypothetical protein L3J54_13655 [Draconibacterium sp.]|nr:hypothetical protein [Draconibacterium sp.]